MATIERVLSAIEKEQKEYAIGRLITPSGKQEFDYGQLSGYVQGLQRAIEIITENIKEPEDDEQSGISSFEETSEEAKMAMRLAEAFPDVDPEVMPLGSRVLVQIKRPKRKSAGGIHLVEETVETDKWNTQVGKVIALGPLALRNRETMKVWAEGEWVKPGDFVRCPKYSGDRFDSGSADDPIQFATFRDLDLINVITGDPLAVKAFIKQQALQRG